MALKEYASKIANELKTNPDSWKQAVKEILNLSVSGEPINASQLENLLCYMQDELEDFCFAREGFSNIAALTLMDMIRKEIKAQQSNGVK